MTTVKLCPSSWFELADLPVKPADQDGGGSSARSGRGGKLKHKHSPGKNASEQEKPLPFKEGDHVEVRDVVARKKFRDALVALKRFRFQGDRVVVVGFESNRKRARLKVLRGQTALGDEREEEEPVVVTIAVGGAGRAPVHGYELYTLNLV